MKNANFSMAHTPALTTGPLVRRRFASLSQAEEENGQSRIYLGIHWAFDKTEGITVANYVFRNAFEPVRRPPRS